jgi:flavin reductase (DIM6/NTAB) family NADH-FMN oxidoreductase RutF
MKKHVLPLSKVYQVIEPGPVVLLTTADAKGRPNVMTLAWHTMLDFTPPLIGCVVSEQNYSFQALLKTKNCALNIPTRREGKLVASCGNCSGRTTDKFAAFKIASHPGKLAPVPLLDACFANLECRVVDTRMAKRYNFFVLEVVKAWIDPDVKNPKTLHHRGYADFMVAGPTLRLPSKMK